MCNYVQYNIHFFLSLTILMYNYYVYLDVLYCTIHAIWSSDHDVYFNKIEIEIESN